MTAEKNSSQDKPKRPDYDRTIYVPQVTRVANFALEAAQTVQPAEASNDSPDQVEVVDSSDLTE